MFKDTALDYISSQPNMAREVLNGLQNEVVSLRKQVAKLQGHDGKTELLDGIEFWAEENQIAHELGKNAFDRSSEKRPKADEAEADSEQRDDLPSADSEVQPSEEDQKGSESKRKKRVKPEGSGRQKVGEDLPLHPETYSLKDGSTCDCATETPLKKVKQVEVTYVVDYVPAKLICRKITRQKYRAKGCGCRVTAPGPTTLVDGGQYGIDLASEIIVRKFQDQLPWVRQAKAFRRDGLELSPTTLWNQSRHVANLLEDPYEAIRKDIEAGYLRHADETGWRVIEGVEHKSQYVWLFRNDRHAYFTIEDTRSGKVPLKVMSGAAGALVADDYAGYNSLVLKNELLRVQCWSHTRRKFFEIRNHYPTIEVFLDLVGKLYQKDREFKNQPDQTAEQRKELCGQIIDDIDEWRKSQRALPKSHLAKALNYMNDNWDGLICFLDDPSLPLDNNPAENALRQVVLGRKNFMFNRSMEGARVTAILYSICVSCTMNGVDPKAYIKETLLRIRNCRGFQLPYEFAKEPEYLNLI